MPENKSLTMWLVIITLLGLLAITNTTKQVKQLQKETAVLHAALVCLAESQEMIVNARICELEIQIANENR